MKKFILIAKKFMPLFAIVILVLTMVYGYHANKMDQDVVQGYYQQLFPKADHFDSISDRTAKAIGADGNLMAYVGICSNVGYGGPMMVGTIINPTGGIQDVVVLQHKETPSYLNKIAQAGYFRQYTKKNAGDSLVLDADIDRVSGATLSTRAIAKSVNDVAHTVAVQELNVTPKKAEISWNIGIKEVAVALLFILSVFIPRFKQLAKYRLVFLGLSIVILGFWLNRSLSMGHISALLLGYFPSPSENLIWYLVLVGALAPALITGKNIYCAYVCPFHGLQEATHMISKVNIPIGKYVKWFHAIKEVILFLVLFFAFLFINPSCSSFEPFGTIFGLNGSSNQWYLLFVILLTSFFYRRFWCVAFCPVGTFVDKVAQLGRKIREIIGLSSKKKVRKVENMNV
ncbi:4Fe-4S binding protein [Dehalobacter sp. 14DCB1]|uniref:4Fe-4S binding protein n=1 Tax=Dehalobacter sp. 14DCB1 TaxID=2070227 RepID=UPI001A9AC110|nr:4Fe-4S binding protein [Dehalobacter sp. 14DCB1]